MTASNVGGIRASTCMKMCIYLYKQFNWDKVKSLLIVKQIVKLAKHVSVLNKGSLIVSLAQ